MFRRMVSKYPDKAMFINDNDGKHWTYREVDEYSNRVANLFLNKDFKKGDTIAMFMESRPEYIATWLGLAKIGLIPALINYNLRKDSLLHTIQVANCKGIIYGLELESAVMEIRARLEEKEPEFRYFHSKSGRGPNANPEKSAMKESSSDLDADIANSSKEPEPESVRRSINVNDPLLFIYTSGTTGLPKASALKFPKKISN